MPVETDALVRSLRNLTLGAIQTFDARRSRRIAEELAELDQQFQIPVAGTVAGSAVWQDVEVAFTAHFFFAPEDRWSPYGEPTFTFGVCQSAGAPVFITCVVREWIRSPDAVTGAKVLVGAVRPGWIDDIGYGTETAEQQQAGLAASAEFVGEVHLNFQGYGVVPDDEENG